MRFYEFKTAQQNKIDALKQQKERVSTQLKTARDAQKKQKAVQAIQQNNATLAKLRNI
jgi:hypothetical protein